MTPFEEDSDGALSRRQVVGTAALASAVAILAEMGGGGMPALAAEPGWMHPFRSRAVIRSDFGPRPSPCAGCSTFHRGLDYAPGRNTPIYAIAAGTVVRRRDTLSYGQFEANSFGNLVVIDHGDGFQSIYAHLELGSAAPLGRVAAGAQVGRVGHNGASTGPHLHVEIKLNGTSIDPEPRIQSARLPVATVIPAPPPPVLKNSDIERYDMLIISTTEAWGSVPQHYTALVGFRSLRHLSKRERDALVKHGQMTQRDMPADDFKAILNALQIPLARAIPGASYNGIAT